MNSDPGLQVVVQEDERRIVVTMFRLTEDGLVAAVAVFALLVGLLLRFTTGAYAETVVEDGDDIIVHGQDYRFHIADAFEPGQVCKDDRGAEYDCGARAKKAVEEIVGNQFVQCQPTGRRDGDRLIARCTAGNADLEVEVVRAGWAFPRRDFRPLDPNRFAELCGIEREARGAKRGAWSGTFDIPFVQKGGGRGRTKAADVVCPGFPIATSADTAPVADFMPTLVTLLPVFLGGLLGLAAGFVGPAYIHGRQTKVDKQKRRAEKFEEFVSAIYEHEHWLNGMRNHRVSGYEAPPLGVSPMAKVRAISTVYFPEFDEQIQKLEMAAREYELWMFDAAQRRLEKKTAPEVLEGHKEAVRKYADEENSLLKDLREHARKEFR